MSFFFKKAPICYKKIFCFQENLNFKKLKRVFPAFCTVFGINRDPCLPANVIDSIYWLCDKFELDALSPCVLFNTMNLPLAKPNTSGQLVMQWLHAMENDCIEIWICKREWWSCRTSGQQIGQLSWKLSSHFIHILLIGRVWMNKTYHQTCGSLSCN